MKRFSIYNTKYNLFDSTPTPPDAYGYHNEVIDEPPKHGKIVGYVRMEDDSIIECYRGFNPAVIVVPLVVLLVILSGVFLYFKVFKANKVDINLKLPVTQKDEKSGDITISYNGFMAIKDGKLTIDFQNGSEEATVSIVAEGISCKPVTIGANEYLDSIPATYSTKEGVVPAKINIKTSTSETEQDVIIEIPENNTADSPEGLEGYWKGEYVYGTGVEESGSK